MMKTLLAMTAVALGAGTAIAQPPVVVSVDQTPFRVVSYDDLNLASKSGKTRLEHRIRAAAGDLCFDGNKDEVKFAMARRGCYNAALNDGLSQMDRAIAARASGTPLAAASLIIRGQ